jgi:hypothetical protein
VRLFIDYEYQNAERDEEGNMMKTRRTIPRINWEVTDAR